MLEKLSEPSREFYILYLTSFREKLQQLTVVEILLYLPFPALLISTRSPFPIPLRRHHLSMPRFRNRPEVNKCECDLGSFEN